MYGHSNARRRWTRQVYRGARSRHHAAWIPWPDRIYRGVAIARRVEIGGRPDRLKSQYRKIRVRWKPRVIWIRIAVSIRAQTQRRDCRHRYVPYVRSEIGRHRGPRIEQRIAD